MSNTFLNLKSIVLKSHDINKDKFMGVQVSMKHKPKFIEGRFGKTLVSLRRARGFTQQELAKKIGVSRRMIVYYELESIHPPVALLPDLARALKVSIEQLLGIKGIKELGFSKDKRLMRRLKQLEELPQKDRRSVLSLIKSLHVNSPNGNSKN